jgi:FMN phosphatase YigB (HAD superfamily)
VTPKLLAFDWFNTLGDIMGFATREERQWYAEQIDRNQKEWRPFELSDRWREMPVFDDVVEGIAKIWTKGVKVVIFSNAPEPLALAMLAHNGVEVDGVVPLERYETSKPSDDAYWSLRSWAFVNFRVEHEEIAVVTANETFGDLEGAKAAGMQSFLIRGEEFPTLFDLEASL